MAKTKYVRKHSLNLRTHCSPSDKPDKVFKDNTNAHCHPGTLLLLKCCLQHGLLHSVITALNDVLKLFFATSVLFLFSFKIIYY